MQLETRIAEYLNDRRGELVGAISVFLDNCDEFECEALQAAFVYVLDRHEERKKAIPPKAVACALVVMGPPTTRTKRSEKLDRLTDYMADAFQRIAQDIEADLAPDADFLRRWAENVRYKDFFADKANLADAALDVVGSTLWAYQQD
jgi:hypothetical protein